MTIVVCNSYPEFYQYVKMRLKPGETFLNQKRFAGVYDDKSANSVISLEAHEVLFLRNPLWIKSYDELGPILRRMRL
jgi:hypothetical protein